MTRHIRTGLIVMLTILLAAGATVPGCRSKKSKKTHDTLEGTVQALKLETREVTMTVYRKKLGKTIPITGKVAAEAEIYIDGKLADLNQVKAGDKVLVEGYKFKDQIVATRVKVVRPDAHSVRIIKPKIPATNKSDQSNTTGK